MQNTNEFENSIGFDINLRSDSSDMQVEEIYQAIKGHFAVPYRKYKPCLKIIYLNLLLAYRLHPDKYISYSRSSSSYKKTDRYNFSGIGFKTIRTVIDTLAKAGLITNKDGFQDKESGIGFNARMRSSTRLRDIFKHDDTGLKNITKVKELIELRDADKQPIGYKDTVITRRMRKKLQAVNDLLLKSEITLPEEIAPNINITANQLHRVFNKNFSRGGRHYGHWVQPLNSAMRKELLIDGEPVVEIDYGGMHPRMIYALEKIEPPPEEDIYYLPGITDIPDQKAAKDNRRAVKLAFLCLTNPKPSEKNNIVRQAAQAAESSIRKKHKEDKIGRIYKYGELKEIVCMILEKHAAIKHMFVPGQGRRLQSRDSKIAEKILVNLTKRGIACIPVFDSFIVQARHEKTLEREMRDAYFLSVREYPRLQK